MLTKSTNNTFLTAKIPQIKHSQLTNPQQSSFVPVEEDMASKKNANLKYVDAQHWCENRTESRYISKP